MYGIGVAFCERGYWSKTYTYKSAVAYNIGDVVVVPANDFFSVGKVVDCKENYEFKPHINYKEIHSQVILK